MSTTERHALSVTVQNNPGVLARVAVLMARRSVNIDHLAVGPTHDPEVSRMTLLVEVPAEKLSQVTAQLHKLVEVIDIDELPDVPGTRQRLWAANQGTPPE